MHEGRTVFAQLMDWLPRYELAKCVARYRGDFHVRSMRCYEQFLILAFAQLTYRESLRDIETCRRALGPKFYHSGIRCRASRSTLADANEKRDWRIFADFAQVLIKEATDLYAEEDFGVELRAAGYALDSTIVDLCLSLFPWAKFRRAKAAVKLHTLLTLRGNFPAVVIVTSGKVHDVNILDELTFDAGSFYIMDRAYLDFGRLYAMHQDRAFFVTRTRENARFRRRYSHAVDKHAGIRFDQTVLLTGVRSHQRFPDPLRRIGYCDPTTNKELTFLTNNFREPATTIAALYKSRWQVELFFKWLKQHLRIKAFYGTSDNAVRVQIWVAISVFVLIAIIRKRAHLPHSPYTILQILSVTLFEKTELFDAFAKTQMPPATPDTQNQQCLPGILTGQ